MFRGAKLKLSVWEPLHVDMVRVFMGTMFFKDKPLKKKTKRKKKM
jgi:hypothetical protein